MGDDVIFKMTGETQHVVGEPVFVVVPDVKVYQELHKFSKSRGFQVLRVSRPDLPVLFNYRLSIPVVEVLGLLQLLYFSVRCKEFVSEYEIL